MIHAQDLALSEPLAEIYMTKYVRFNFYGALQDNIGYNYIPCKLDGFISEGSEIERF